jgi:hypothetical protein
VSRCKLISPVLLQLERPMLSPVEENEFVIQGVKAYSRKLTELFYTGFLVGLLFAAILVAIFTAVRE